MLQKIPIKSLEDIALRLIKRDNETKKDIYNYHDTVKELEFEIKNQRSSKYDNKEEIKIITASKKERQTQEEITKTLKTTKTLNSTNNINYSNGNYINHQKMPNKRLSCKPLKNNINKKQFNYNNIKNNSKEKEIKEKDEFIMIICYIYNKTILFLSPIIVFYIIILTSYYLIAGRNITRLQRISYSPIMTIFSETIRGLDIIRTSHAEENTKIKFFEKIDERYGFYLFGEGCKRWHAVRRSIFIQLIFGVIILYMAYYSDTYSVRAIAIILQYTEEFLLHLINISLFYIELENSMIGLERCEQIVKIEMEKDIFKNEILINEDWSKKGNIEFINYYASYRPNTPEILKNINLKIESEEKIGIVGKTGSGKSSLINALARIIEPKKGNIFIDDIDIQNISLNILREKISILPQEPFIIESTLRDNIDPLNKYKDEDILNILEDLSLFINLENEKKLNLEIKENGNNLSSGEKILICFARTIIKKNKIAIIDEVTSSLDDVTKKIIFENIEKYLKNSTVIMITNQIEILKKCNKIIIIDNGKIVETGKYDNLIEDKNSLFYSLFK